MERFKEERQIMETMREGPRRWNKSLHFFGNYDSYKRPAMEAAIERYCKDHPGVRITIKDGVRITFKDKAQDVNGQIMKDHFSLWVGSMPNENVNLTEFWKIYREICGGNI